MRPCSSFANISALERRQLEDEVRHGRTAIRALMILLSAAGYPAVSIAELVGYDPRTVRRWIERFVVEGVDGLPDRSRTGRPGSTARVAGRLSTLLAQPKEAWTVPRLARALRWSASSSTLRRRLRGLAQWRRPRLVAKGDSETPLRWAAVRRALRQLPAHAVVVAEDECHLDLLPWVWATWILRGQRQLVMTPRAEPVPLPLRGR
jgi:transposase